MIAIHILKKFVDKYVDLSRPILLGLSGGPDSMALLHLLSSFKQLNFAVAHVDHGWRAESAGEALLLQRLADKMSLRFHLKALDPNAIEGNIEEFCRKERLSFFKELCCLHGYQGVLLGHHADDQSETVLKRVFEGASLIRLGAMKPKTVFEGLTIFRPMLTISRKEILGIIEDSALSPFYDATNRDPKFLRARLREQTLPFLTAQFGKNISKALLSLAKEAQELEAYLDGKVAPYIASAVEGPLGVWVDLSQNCPSDDIELRHLLKRLCQYHLPLSKEQFAVVCSLLHEGAADRSVEAGEGALFVDRRHLFIMKKKIPPCTSTLALSNGTHSWGAWTIHVEETGENSPPASSWKDLWRGDANAVLPHGQYEIGPCCSSENYPRTHSINKWWGGHKVPAFMRPWVPIVRGREGIGHEFLTGKTKKISSNVRKTLISISLNSFYIS